MIRFALLLSAAVVFTAPAFARDDGGFGSGFSQKAPSAFSDPAPEALAKYQDPLNPAAIEPAAGETPDAAQPVAQEETKQDAPSAPLNKPQE
jgi:hypothetical protein